MPFLKLKSLCPDIELPDAAEDHRGASRIAQFRISEKAFYLPAFPGTQYIPFSGLTQVILRNGSLSTIGCCGKELPVLKLTLRWGGGETEVVIDPPKHAHTILTLIQTARPELTVDDRR